MQELRCMCCGKTSKINVQVSQYPNRSAYVECGYCGYEHRAEVRNNVVVHVTTP